MIRIFLAYILGAIVTATSYVAYMSDAYIPIVLSGFLVAAATGWVWMVGESIKADRLASDAWQQREEKEYEQLG